VLKIIRIILSVIVIVLGIYGLITNNFVILPYTLSLLGVITIIFAISELKQKRKIGGIICILVAMFVFYVVIRTTLFR
jgi:hypothetical protein